MAALPLGLFPLRGRCSSILDVQWILVGAFVPLNRGLICLQNITHLLRPLVPAKVRCFHAFLPELVVGHMGTKRLLILVHLTHLRFVIVYLDVFSCGLVLSLNLESLGYLTHLIRPRPSLHNNLLLLSLPFFLFLLSSHLLWLLFQDPI